MTSALAVGCGRYFRRHDFRLYGYKKNYKFLVAINTINCAPKFTASVEIVDNV